jgi:hypothetical protein
MLAVVFAGIGLINYELKITNYENKIDCHCGRSVAKTRNLLIIVNYYLTIIYRDAD